MTFFFNAVLLSNFQQLMPEVFPQNISIANLLHINLETSALPNA